MEGWETARQEKELGLKIGRGGTIRAYLRIALK
jgi:hypothetical protein